MKSSSTRSRDHVFSFEQVYPPSGASVLVASVYVEDQTNGRLLGTYGVAWLMQLLVPMHD